jgi:hypothetical protein
MLEPWSASVEIEARPVVTVPALNLVAELMAGLAGDPAAPPAPNGTASMAAPRRKGPRR